MNKIYAIATTNYSYLETSAINGSDQVYMKLPLSIDYIMTFAGSIFIMADFSTTSTYFVKDMQMFLGNVLIINQVSVK